MSIKFSFVPKFHLNIFNRLQIGETFEVEEDDNASLSSDNTSSLSGEVEEGEVICVEDDSDDAGCVHLLQVSSGSLTYRPWLTFDISSIDTKFQIWGSQSSSAATRARIQGIWWRRRRGKGGFGGWGMGGAEESQVKVSLLFKNFFGIVIFDERAIETPWSRRSTGYRTSKLIVSLLRTDLERLKYAQRAFGNCIPTDPTRCLTFHG